MSYEPSPLNCDDDGGRKMLYQGWTSPRVRVLRSSPKEFARASAVAWRQCHTYLPERLTRGEISRRRWSLGEELSVAGSSLAASIAVLLGLTEASLLGEAMFSPIIRCEKLLMAQAGRLLASSGGRRHCAQLQCCKAHTSCRQDQLSASLKLDMTQQVFILFCSIAVTIGPVAQLVRARDSHSRGRGFDFHPVHMCYNFFFALSHHEITTGVHAQKSACIPPKFLFFFSFFFSLLFWS